MHRYRTTTSLIGLVVVVSALLVACSGGGGKDGPAEPAGDLLAHIREAGVLRVATDADYPPQSSLNKATGRWKGFDIDVSTEIATRMGVATQWETPARDVLVAGNWDGGWDIAVNSMSITEERATALDFTEPYYFTPAGVAVTAGSDLTTVAQLAGKRVGVCGACTYRRYLERTLVIPGFDVEFLVPADIDIVTFETDSAALQALSQGRIDAVVSAVPTIEEAVADGRDLRLLGIPVFREPLAIAADKSSSLPVDGLVAELNRIISDMHADGTLSGLSEKWYGVDLTKAVSR